MQVASHWVLDCTFPAVQSPAVKGDNVCIVSGWIMDIESSKRYADCFERLLYARILSFNLLVTFDVAWVIFSGSFMPTKKNLNNFSFAKTFAKKVQRVQEHLLCPFFVNNIYNICVRPNRELFFFLMLKVEFGCHFVFSVSLIIPKRFINISMDQIIKRCYVFMKEFF